MMQADQRAITAGGMAQAALAVERCAWRVLASVSGAIYIQREPTELLWVTDRATALHSRAIVVQEMPDPLPPAGSACHVGRGMLRIDESWGVDCRYARRWMPNGWEGFSRGPDLHLDRLESALAAVALLSPLHRGIAGTAPFVEWTNDGDRIQREILSVAREAMDTCRQSAADCELLDIVQGCHGLIGLGSGLTPSGDDFLAAYLFTMRAWEVMSGTCFRTDWEGILDWLQQVSARTNVISSTLLLDCAEGVAAAPLHEFVHAVLRRASIDELTMGARWLAGIGHSSGWDMLTGVHAAIVSLNGLNCDAGERDRMNRHAACRKEVFRVR